MLSLALAAAAGAYGQEPAAQAEPAAPPAERAAPGTPARQAVAPTDADLDRLCAERRRVEPGRASAPAEPGQGVLAAFGRAGRELVSPPRPTEMGSRTYGPVVTTIVTNPIGWFTGLGVNLELFRSIAPKLSLVGGARYSKTAASNGSASAFGALAGADLFLFGRHNEGLRLGPRLEVAAGREDIQGETTFGWVGLGGEAGWNFIASNGVTALLAGGFGGRVAGDERNDDFASFVGGELGPYVKLGLGWSW
jgi:hypothetical protein